MEGLLSVSSTKRLSKKDDEELLKPAEIPQPTQTIQVPSDSTSDLRIITSHDLLQTLQSKPSFEALKLCLQWLASPVDGFNIKIPGPQATRIISVLVNELTTDYWHVLRDDQGSRHVKERNLYVKSLSSVAGIGALCSRLRSLLDFGKQEQNTKAKITRKQLQNQIRDVLEIMHLVLRGKDTLENMWTEIRKKVNKPIQRQLLVKEIVTQIASGRILSLAAEALDFCELSRAGQHPLNWLGEGRVFSCWLGQNIRSTFEDVTDEDEDTRKLGASLLIRGISLGYSDALVEASLSAILKGKESCIGTDLRLYRSLTFVEKSRILPIVLRLLNKRLLSVSDSDIDQLVRGLAAVVEKLVQEDQSLLDILLNWLTISNAGGIGTEIGTRRAVLAVIFEHSNTSTSNAAVSNAGSKPDYGTLLTKALLTQFSDRLFIQHSPVLNQENCAQNLLISVGWMFRTKEDYVREMARSGPYLNAVSNRLAASSERARFLGMVFGMAVSELVDPPDRKINFDIESNNGADGKWYQSLTNIKDTIGNIKYLRAMDAVSSSDPIPKTSEKGGKLPTSSKIVEIVEISDEIESEVESSDDDLPVYAKPDSDQEDEDEDPTLIQRNKAVAPVYIRDLIAGLRDSENYDRHKLAISTAANLIRRKSNFGTEVSEHIEDLAAKITGLKDTYDIEKFQEQRIQAMVALVVTQPLQMGQWFSVQLFSGDYALSQRASILTALTLAARELAGYREEDAELTGAYVANEQLFPSKKLPDKYEKVYKLDAAPVNAISHQLERTMIKPLATEAVEELTGPKALKVRTFSSRMEVEKKRKRPITNELAKIVADGFFFPLVNRWRVNLQLYGDNSAFKTSFLQAHFIKTLALILAASGTSTLSLPAMTVEFWSLLLSLRAAALSAKPVLESLLFAFLTILDINSNDQRRVAEDHSRELLETQAWVEKVVENHGAGTKEDDKVRVLAAGVLVRAKEVVYKYQRLLMGELVNYM